MLVEHAKISSGNVAAESGLWWSCCDGGASVVAEMLVAFNGAFRLVFYLFQINDK